MTAEIAILNRNAVALAADSAVTLQHPKGYKIYNTVSKLFTLTKYQPVGIMVYGSADIMEAPWETVIKIFRNSLGSREFDTLDQYAEHFLKFFAKDKTLFPTQKQSDMSGFYIRRGLERLRKKIDVRVEEEIRRDGSINVNRVKIIVRQEVQGYLAQLRREEAFEALKSIGWRGVLTPLGGSHRVAVREVLEKLPLAGTFGQLEEICGHLLARRTLKLNYTGIVIAGFGQKEPFPSLVSYECDFVTANKLRYVRTNKVTVGTSGTDTVSASIVPFAQREMVNRFMEGIDPQYQSQISNYLSTLLQKGYPDKVTEILKGKIEKNSLVVLKQTLVDLGGKLLTDFSNGIREYQRRQFIDPIVASVELLPKDELAAMAQSLVNLTAFKRKVTSVEADTVALPIDVAVISKGDGFVWIKRKHYFDKDLNPYFIQNYFRKREA